MNFLKSYILNLNLTFLIMLFSVYGINAQCVIPSGTTVTINNTNNSPSTHPFQGCSEITINGTLLISRTLDLTHMGPLIIRVIGDGINNYSALLDFSNNEQLFLAENSALILLNGGALGIDNPCSNSQRIFIGGYSLARCSGGGNAEYTFPMLNDLGGTVRVDLESDKEEICFGDEFTMTAFGAGGAPQRILTWSANGPDGYTFSNTGDSIHTISFNKNLPNGTYNKPGLYNFIVEIQDSLGFTFKDSVQINIKPPTTYKSIQTGDWNEISTWEHSCDMGVNWRSSVEFPKPNEDVEIRVSSLTGVSVNVNHTHANPRNKIVVYQAGILNQTQSSAFDFESLTINGMFVQGNDNPINGDITVNGTGVYRHDFNGGYLPNDIVWNPNSTLQITGFTSESNFTSGAGQNFKNVIFNSNLNNGNIFVFGSESGASIQNLTVNNTGSGSLAMAGDAQNILNVNNITVNNGYVSTNTPNANNLWGITVSGDININGGTLDLSRNMTFNSIVTMTGNINIASNGTLLSSTDKLVVNLNGNINNSGNFQANNNIYNVSGNITNNGNYFKEKGTLNISGSIINNNDMELDNGVINIAGDLYNNGSFVSYNDNIVRFTNTGNNQTLGGTSITLFENIEVAKVTGLELGLDNNINVSGQIIMTAGNFRLNQKSIDLGFTGEIINEQEDRRIYCVCPSAFIRKEVEINHPYSGNPGNMGLTITTNGNSMGYTEMFRRHNEGQNNSNNPASVHRVFDVNPTNNGDLNVDLEFQYFEAEFVDGVGINDAEDFVIFRSVDGGVSWLRMENATADPIAKTVSYQGWNQFSQVTVGSNEVSPLPVSLLSFNAQCVAGSGVELKWQTASEINNDYFTIERSYDAENFTEIGVVYGAGNSNRLLDYSLVDYEVFEETKTIYYRLRQTDFDGTEEVFNVVFVSCGDINGSNYFNIYPNPAKESFTLNAVVTDRETYEFRIFNNTGKMVYDEQLNLAVGSNNHFVNIAHLSSGFYNVVLLNKEGKVISERLLIQK